MFRRDYIPSVKTASNLGLSLLLLAQGINPYRDDYSPQVQALIDRAGVLFDEGRFDELLAVFDQIKTALRNGDSVYDNGTHSFEFKDPPPMAPPA